MKFIINKLIIIFIQDHKGELRTVWSKLGSQSPNWLSVELDILIEPPHTVIVIEAGALEWKHGEIAISRTELLKTSCKGIL